jgi:cytochrome c
MKTFPVALALSLLSGVCLADPAQDGAMVLLARDRGCLACHAIDRSTATSATPATPAQGPAWRDLAARYKSVKGAQQELTARIMTGSSDSADRRTSYPRHWGEQVSGDFMPSHRSAVTEVEAAQLVAFILALDPKR